MDEFPQILAIFYAEFHITQGSQVLFEVPEGFTNSINDGPLKVDFDSFSEYMIPKSALCNQLVTISTTNFRIMGYPVLLQDSKYERNALLFNLCFVFEKSANILSFEQIVTKIARVLRALEVRAILNKVESEFLSNPETKSTLPNIITQIMEDLNSYHECQISVNDSNRIDLKLFPVHSEPPPVYDYQVPILITDLTKYIDRHWDITMRRIVDFVNGVNTVHKIAYKSDVDITYVRIAIQHLLYYGCAKVIDIFQFGNIYATTSGINRLSESEELQNECIEFVRKPDCLAPSVGMIFSLYCSLKGNMSLLDWMRENPVYSSQVDIRRFIAFGVIHEIILRIHNYPIYYNPKDDKVPHEVLEISQYLNGQHHLDDLCTRFNKGPKEMQELLNIPQIQSIFK